MSFLAILCALLLEQARPLAQINPVYGRVRSWMRWGVRNCDTGISHHAWLAWSVVVLVPALLVLGVHYALLATLGWLAAVLWHIAILYVTLGFRQFSHHFTDIRDALDAGDEDAARHLLAQWMRMDASALPRSEIVRHVLECSVLSAHRHVFGVFAWYSLLAALGLGPAGAVLYRLGEYAKRFCDRQGVAAAHVGVSDALRARAQNAWHAMDWFPARVTALSFAFVGSFEEAVDGWRQYEATQSVDNDGVILAATAGAVGVTLGAYGADIGQAPATAHLRAVVGLVWRTVVLWMVFLALLSLARLLG